MALVDFPALAPKLPLGHNIEECLKVLLRKIRADLPQSSFEVSADSTSPVAVEFARGGRRVIRIFNHVHHISLPAIFFRSAEPLPRKRVSPNVRRFFQVSLIRVVLRASCGRSWSRPERENHHPRSSRRHYATVASGRRGSFAFSRFDMPLLRRICGQTFLVGSENLLKGAPHNRGQLHFCGAVSLFAHIFYRLPSGELWTPSPN